MASLDANELTVTLDTRTDIQKRCIAEVIQPKRFAAGNGTIAILTPLAYNTSTNNWVVWSFTDGVSDKETITVDATGGTYTITVTALGGSAQTTGNIAFNATAATVAAAILQLDNVTPGDVSVTGGVGASGGGTPYVVTFGGNLAEQVVTVTTTATNLTGGASTAAVVHTKTGSAGTGIDDIKGFSWPDPIVLGASTEVTGNVMLEGILHYADVVLPAGEVENNLKTAMRTQCRNLGITVQGLTQVR